MSRGRPGTMGIKNKQAFLLSSYANGSSTGTTLNSLKRPENKTRFGLLDVSRGLANITGAPQTFESTNVLGSNRLRRDLRAGLPVPEAGKNWLGTRKNQKETNAMTPLL